MSDSEFQDKWGNYGIEIRFKKQLTEEQEKKLIERIKHILKTEELDYIDICTWVNGDSNE